MANICKKCGGKCCLETEMPISMQDIKKILNNYPDKIKMNDFALEITSSCYQLKNINGHCYFFNCDTKLCSIYDFRPRGCRFYPLIYDYDEHKCIFDNLCTRPDFFFVNNQDLKKRCKELKKFLMNELEII